LELDLFQLNTNGRNHNLTSFDIISLQEEPQAERLPSATVNQMEQADVAANKEVSSGAISSFGQVTEQHNITATSATLVQPSTQLQLYDLTCQNVAHPCQESGVNTCSISTGLDNHETLNIQQQSANQTSSMVEHMPENGLQSVPVTNGCRQLLMSSNRTSPPVRVTKQQIATSPPVQVIEQQNASNSSLLTPHERQQYGPQTCQTVAHQDQPVGTNSFPAQAWLDSPGSSNVQQQSNNQTTTGSTSGQYMPESGPQSDPLTIEMSRLLLMHDLMTKKHISKVTFLNPSTAVWFSLCSSNPKWHSDIGSLVVLLSNQHLYLNLVRGKKLSWSVKRSWLNANGSLTKSSII